MANSVPMVYKFIDNFSIPHSLCCGVSSTPTLEKGGKGILKLKKSLPKDTTLFLQGSFHSILVFSGFLWVDSATFCHSGSCPRFVEDRSGILPEMSSYKSLIKGFPRLTSSILLCLLIFFICFSRIMAFNLSLQNS